MEADSPTLDGLPKSASSWREDKAFRNHRDEAIPRQESRSPAGHHPPQASEQRPRRLDSELHSPRSGPRTAKGGEEFGADGPRSDCLPRLVLPLRQDAIRDYRNETTPRRVSWSPARHHAHQSSERRPLLPESALHSSSTGPRAAKRENPVQSHRRSHSQALIYSSMDGPYPDMHRRNRSFLEPNVGSRATAAPKIFETEDQKMITRRLKHAKGKLYDGGDWGDDGDEWGDVGFYDGFGVWNGHRMSEARKSPLNTGLEVVDVVEKIVSLAVGC